MRKRKLYVSELLKRYIVKSYQYIYILDNQTSMKYYLNKAPIWSNKQDISEELMNLQVVSWEFIENTLYIYV